MVIGFWVRRSALYGGLIGGLFAADASGTFEAAGVDVWSVPALEQQLKADRDFSDVLDMQEAVVLNRMAAKTAITADLKAGRCTLADATDEFQQLNAEHPESYDFLFATYRCPDEREATARNVLTYADVGGPGPDRGSPAAARIRAEFVTLFGHAAD